MNRPNCGIDGVCVSDLYLNIQLNLRRCVLFFFFLAIIIIIMLCG